MAPEPLELAERGAESGCVARLRNDPQPSLLEHAGRFGKLGAGAEAPLADRMRPRILDEICGQQHLVGPGKWLRRAIESDRLPSLIFWGPPGVGKTTLAQVIALSTKRRFVPFSAVLGGVPELRVILKEAEEDRRYRGVATILFVDEIHRFNKAQQDAFLPHVERGTITLIGATTENPSFAVNAAVLSRAKVQRLQGLSVDDLSDLLKRSLADAERGLGKYPVEVAPRAIESLCEAAAGDARRALSLLEAVVSVGLSDKVEGETLVVEAADLEELLDNKTLLYDKSGEEHYNVIDQM